MASSNGGCEAIGALLDSNINFQFFRQHTQTLHIKNEVFRKIKEISAQTVIPRPLINTVALAYELGISRERLTPWLTELKASRLVMYQDAHAQEIKLTLLGTVVIR